jgi:hypothetical protein
MIGFHVLVGKCEKLKQKKKYIWITLPNIIFILKITSNFAVDRKMAIKKIRFIHKRICLQSKLSLSYTLLQQRQKLKRSAVNFHPDLTLILDYSYCFHQIQI